MIFQDRKDAGTQLGRVLISYGGPDTIVYALPRGGAVVGAEVAQIIGSPLDLTVVRKIGHPACPEYAIAAVAEDGHTVSNAAEVRNVDNAWFDQEVQAQRQEAKRRRTLYLGERHPLPATGKIAVIVDDGLATGLTMFLAIEELRHDRPRKIVVAVPVAPADTVRELKTLVDAVEVLYVPVEFGAIGSFYRRFDQVSDAEVIRIMKTARAGPV